MKLTFAYDGVLLYDSNGKWYGRNYANLAEKYKELSDDITYLMRIRYDEDASDKMAAMPENCKVVGVPDFLGVKKLLLNRVRAQRVIEEQVKATDCLVIRLPGTISRIAIRCARKYHKPYIVEVVGCVWDSLTNHSLLGKIIAPAEFALTKECIANSRYVMYVTNEFLQHRYPTKGLCIGVSDVDLSPIDKEQLAARKAREEDHLVIGTAGAISVRLKGQEYVIDAIAKLQTDSTKVVYHLAGGGDSSRLREIVLKRGLEDRIVFDGSIPHENMNEWYDGLDMYIQPSRTEGLPRALLEAMSRSIACYGSNAGGIPELLPEECIFDVGDVDSITSIIQNATEETLFRIGEQCYKKSQDYTTDKLEERRVTFYRQFLRDLGWK